MPRTPTVALWVTSLTGGLLSTPLCRPNGNSALPGCLYRSFLGRAHQPCTEVDRSTPAQGMLKKGLARWLGERLIAAPFAPSARRVLGFKCRERGSLERGFAHLADSATRPRSLASFGGTSIPFGRKFGCRSKMSTEPPFVTGDFSVISFEENTRLSGGESDHFRIRSPDRGPKLGIVFCPFSW